VELNVALREGKSTMRGIQKCHKKLSKLRMANVGTHRDGANCALRAKGIGMGR